MVDDNKNKAEKIFNGYATIMQWPKNNNLSVLYGKIKTKKKKNNKKKYKIIVSVIIVVDDNVEFFLSERWNQKLLDSLSGNWLFTSWMPSIQDYVWIAPTTARLVLNQKRKNWYLKTTKKVRKMKAEIEVLTLWALI